MGKWLEGQGSRSARICYDTAARDTIMMLDPIPGNDDRFSYRTKN